MPLQRVLIFTPAYSHEGFPEINITVGTINILLPLVCHEPLLLPLIRNAPDMSLEDALQWVCPDQCPPLPPSSVLAETACWEILK